MDYRAETLERTKNILKDVLQLGKRAEGFGEDTPLLGAIPELDSMAVVTVLTGLEEEFGISISDDDVSAEVFHTVGSLADFVARLRNP